MMLHSCHVLCKLYIVYYFNQTSVISKSYGEFAFNANNAASGETALCDNLVSIPDGPDHDDLENSSDGATDG